MKINLAMSNGEINEVMLRYFKGTYLRLYDEICGTGKTVNLPWRRLLTFGQNQEVSEYVGP